MSEDSRIYAAQDTLTFVGSHPGITVTFVGFLLILLGYFWRETQKAKNDSTFAVIEGLKTTLMLQRETIDSTLIKLNVTVDRLEKTVVDLAAELFRDMHCLDRRLSKLEGEHDAHHKHRRIDD